MVSKKLAVIVAAFISFLLASNSLYAATIHLAWDPSSGTVNGYRIYYGTSSGNYPNRVEVGNVTECTISDLQDGITYYFVARAYNDYGESGNSNEVTWTAGDVTPPGDVANLQAVPGPGKITFSWTNPTDSDFAGVMIRYRTDGTYPQDTNDGYAVPNGNNGKITGNPGQNMSYVHDNLDPTKHYYYSFFTYDTSGNYSHTAHVDVQPLPTNHDPVINSFVVSPTSLNNPYETATFTASATDQDGDTLTYTISFGDGNSATGNNVTHAYTAAGQYTATLTVSDGNGGISTKQITITVNDLPPAAPTGVQVQ